jgi:hypothetical protein
MIKIQNDINLADIIGLLPHQNTDALSVAGTTGVYCPPKI